MRPAQCHKLLIKMPCAARLASDRFHAVSKVCTEYVAPASHRLVCHDQAALEEQLFDVTQGQLEAEVATHGATDDAGWKLLTLIQRF